MYKKVHSDLFVQATVKGSEVKRGQILDIIEFQFYQCHHVVLGKLGKLSTVTSSSDLRLRGQRSKKVKFQTSSYSNSG